MNPPSSPMVPASARLDPRVAPALLFVSGGVALVYEVIWQRQFALLFGSAAPATATVLAAYFAGLGVGAYVIGRWAASGRHSLRTYAVLELGVAVGALLVVPIAQVVDACFLRFTGGSMPASGTLLAIRAVGAFAAVLLPTFCMGGTLPVLGQLADAGRRELGIIAGGLYVVNTVGAGLGALAVPFLVLPALGLDQAVNLAAAINGALALAAWSLHRRAGADFRIEHQAKPPKSRSTDHVGQATPASLSLLAGISGVVTFALQVLWNRAFAQIHENSMYSFAVIVAVVIFALALGAQLARWGVRRRCRPAGLIAVAWLLSSVGIALGPWLFFKLSDGLAYLSAGSGWLRQGGALSLLAIAVLAMPMALLGLALPALMEQAGKHSQEAAGQVLGRLLAANIVGSVVGALLAGFILPGWLGLWGSMGWLAVVVFACGGWQAIRWRSVASGRIAGVIGLGLCLASTLGLAHISLPRVRFATDGRDQLRNLQEGPHGIVAVVERPGSVRLKLNNHYGLGGTASTGDERMQAHLPLLLHAAPRQVAFLGLGTGITAGGALNHPVDRITVVELVPEVVASSRYYFREANQAVLDDPRTVVVSDDARHFLRNSRDKFDVIVGDLVVPWRQGEGALFTLEQFQLARAGLKPGGLFCQWLPLFQLSEVELQILLRTFLTVFPEAQIWRGDFSPTEPALALIGGAEGKAPLIVPDNVEQRLAGMVPDSTNPQLQSVEAFWMYYVGRITPADLSPTETRINSENRPWIELLGPRLHAGHSADTLFVGRKLQAWLDMIAQRSAQRAAALPAREIQASAAGRALAELTLSLAEGNHGSAQAAQQKLQTLVSPETFRLLAQ